MMYRHRVWPFFQGGVRNKGGDWHTRPHGSAVDVWFFLIFIRFAARKDHLKTQAPRGHGSNADNHGV